jgi:orotidine-5'-phosphate decarboxylase
VVGATAPAELADLRTLAPDRAFLMPGIGAQGGDLAAALRDGPATAGSAGAGSGGGLLVNVGRGIAGAAAGVPSTEVEARIAASAAEWAARMPVLEFARA